MAFSVTARTMLQLGMELIHSDAIAFYELVKNAYDARSKSVRIAIRFRMGIAQVQSFRERLKGVMRDTPRRQQDALAATVRELTAVLDGISDAPDHAQLLRALRACTSPDALLTWLDEINVIEIADQGYGMDFETLDTVFMTIGTRRKYLEKQEHPATSRPILGEKGLGRLSAMRLGWTLHVRTATEAEERWNLLDIDWRAFSHDVDATLESVDVKPVRGPRKEIPDQHGTLIRITGLHADWPVERVKKLCMSSLSRFSNPFDSTRGFKILVNHNHDPVPQETFDTRLLEHADGHCTFSFTAHADDNHLTGVMEYKALQKTKRISIDDINLCSATSMTSESLAAIGSFSGAFYWFKRRHGALAELGKLSADDEVHFLKVLAMWGGGLMLFRDGFRVHPYGDPEDDWLDLDVKALASGGYKVNRRQIIGEVQITSRANPRLRDQTNREGLRDCPEKDGLRHILKHLMQAQFRTFLNVEDRLAKQQSEAKTLPQLEERAAYYESRLDKNLAVLTNLYPKLKNTSNIQNIRDNANHLMEIMRTTKTVARSLEERHGHLLRLAGVGIVVEVVVHELGRASLNAISMIRDMRKDVDAPVGERLATLESQLRTLRKRLAILDPLTSPTRQVKIRFDLVSWINDILATHEVQFTQAGITCTCRVTPATTRRIDVSMVQGMVVQILENLLANSIYWLDLQARLGRQQEPAQITIDIDPDTSVIKIRDNGPGIDPEHADAIFEPYFTTKANGEGKGLGLFIARQVAEYHKCRLDIAPEPESDGRLRTFLFSYKNSLA